MYLSSSFFLLVCKIIFGVPSQRTMFSVPNGCDVMLEMSNTFAYTFNHLFACSLTLSLSYFFFYLFINFNFLHIQFFSDESSERPKNTAAKMDENEIT